MIERSAYSTNDVEQQAERDRLSAESERLDTQQARFGEPTDGEISFELSERARLLREREAERNWVTVRMNMTPEQRHAEILETYPELSLPGLDQAAKERAYRLVEIEWHEQELTRLREEDA